MPYGIARFIGRRQPAIFAALPPTAFLPRKNSTGLFGEGKSDDGKEEDAGILAYAKDDDAVSADLHRRKACVSLSSEGRVGNENCRKRDFSSMGFTEHFGEVLGCPPFCRETGESDAEKRVCGAKCRHPAESRVPAWGLAYSSCFLRVARTILRAIIPATQAPRNMGMIMALYFSSAVSTSAHLLSI